MGFFVCFAVLVVACFGQQNHSEGLRFLREFWTSLNGAAWQYPAVAPDESQWFYGGSEDYCSFWGVHCSDNVTISVIALDNMNLQGELPDDFAPLTGLINLQLQNNGISGSIPASLFGAQLLNLYLQLNNLTGEIPSSVTSSSIRECYLSNNGLSGEIPSFPNTTLMLDLAENDLSGTLDLLLSNLPFVYSLNLRSNNISGRLPDSIFKCAYLSILILDDNKLTGIPSVVSGLPRTAMVSMKNNLISGTMPLWLMTTPNRTYLDISNNMFSGPSPLTAVKRIYSTILKVTFIAKLDFSFNNFSVTTFSNLFDLAYLHFSAFDFVNLDGLPVEPLPNSTGADAFRRYFTFSDRPQPVLDPSYECNLTVLIRSQRVYFQLPPEFWSYKNCRCAATYWGEPPFCQKCSDKVRCGGEDLYITETQYPVFGANSSLLGLLPCEHCEDGVARFGHTAHYEACDEGYEGRLCDECVCHNLDDCYFKKQGACVQCQHGEIWQLAVAIAALGVGMLAFIFLKQGSGLLLILECIIALSLMLVGVGASYLVDFVIFFVLLQLVEAASNFSSASDGSHANERIVSLTGMAKHLIFYIQATVILTRNEFFPKSLSRVASAVNVLNFRSSGLECFEWFQVLAHQFSPTTVKFGVSMLMPFLLVVFMATCLTLRKLYMAIKAAIIRACCKREHVRKELVVPSSEEQLITHDVNSSDVNSPSDHHQHQHHAPPFGAELLSMILFVFFATYFELTDVILENLSCSADPFTFLRYLESEPAVACFGPDYETLQAFAWIMFGVIVMGVPIVLMSALMYYRKRLHDHNVELVLGMLYENYKHKLFWWEAVWIAKRIGIAFAVGFLGESSWSAVVVSLVLVAVSSMSYFAQPFKHEFENTVELGTTGVLLITYSSALVEDRQASAVWFVFGLNVVWVLVLVGLLLFYPLRQIMQRFKRWRAKRNKQQQL